MSIEERIQSLDLGAKVQLFVIDATNMGGQVLRIAPEPFGGNAVVFDGEIYTPIPLKLSGLSWTGNGGVPRPSLTLSNIDGQLVTMLLTVNDLVGARLTIIETFVEFLDEGTSPDPSMRFPDEEFVIDRLVEMNNVVVSWQLSPLLDQRGVKLPRRQILRDVCVARYRRYDGVDFDYSKATCPYVGDEYFDRTNEPTDMPGDQCAKTLSACKLRFGEHVELPFDGFPGAARVREDG